MGLVLVLALAAGGWFFLVARPVAVEVATVERDIAVQVFGLGTVEARLLSRVGFALGGAVVEVNADHGDRVQHGAVLARLNGEVQAARVAKAAAVLAQAKASRERARSVVARAEAQHAQRRSASTRRAALASRGAASEETAEDARAATDIAAADLAVARSEAAVSDASVQDAEAQLLVETVLRDQHVLLAPYDALVIGRTKELGAVVAPGEAVFTLIDPTTVWARAFVDEAQAGALALGQRAEVRLRSLPHRMFEASVERIEIESDRVTEERRVYVKCSQCPQQFHLGEQAEILITIARLAAATAIPETMIQRFDGARGTAWTIEDGTLRQRQLAFSHRLLDGRAVVAEPLPEGVQVVVAARGALEEGRAGRIVGDVAP